MTSKTGAFLRMIFSVAKAKGPGKHLGRCPVCGSSVYILVTDNTPYGVRAACINPKCQEEYRWRGAKTWEGKAN